MSSERKTITNASSLAWVEARPCWGWVGRTAVWDGLEGHEERPPGNGDGSTRMEELDLSDGIKTLQVLFV